MGYSTDFQGKLKFNRQLTLDDYNFLRKLAGTRRMARNVGKEFGVEGEFYVDGTGVMGQGSDDNIIDHNKPPKTQPGLWLQWTPTEDGKYLEWDGVEKFYNYVDWLEYLIQRVFPHLQKEGEEPYVLNGSISWQGEDFEDRGIITVVNNKITTQRLDVPANAVECPNCGDRFVPELQ